MTDDDRRRAAQACLEIPFFRALLDEMERTEVNRCLSAHMNDDETRRNAAAEARAIRSLRQKLESAASDGQSTAGKRAPA